MTEERQPESAVEPVESFAPAEVNTPDTPAVQAQQRFSIWRQCRAVCTMHPKRIASVLMRTYSDWSADSATRLGAALAYYTLFSIAPVLIGDGRPAIRLPPHLSLRDCRRPGYRVFRMGGDVLFDCDLRATAQQSSSDVDTPITRVI